MAHEHWSVRCGKANAARRRPLPAERALLPIVMHMVEAQATRRQLRACPLPVPEGQHLLHPVHRLEPTANFQHCARHNTGHAPQEPVALHHHLYQSPWGLAHAADMQAAPGSATPPGALEPREILGAGQCVARRAHRREVKVREEAVGRARVRGDGELEPRGWSGGVRGAMAIWIGCRGEARTPVRNGFGTVQCQTTCRANGRPNCQTNNCRTKSCTNGRTTCCTSCRITCRNNCCTVHNGWMWMWIGVWDTLRGRVQWSRWPSTPPCPE